MNYKNYCSPLNKIKNNNNFSCYDNDSIIELAKAYNTYINKKNVKNMCLRKKSKKPICSIKKVIDLNKSVKEIYYELIYRLKKICPMEYEWIKLPFVNEIKNTKRKRSLKKSTFLPEQPHNKEAWLSTDNLNNSINQYEELFDYLAKERGNLYFKFLGAQPSDISKISKIPWDELFKYNNIGIIFNTDTHNKPGKHWLAVYIDNKKRSIEYFDSLGDGPNKHIKHFLKTLLNKGYSFRHNVFAHQKGGSQCGQYSLTFIKHKLNGETFDEIVNNHSLFNDTEMIKERDKFFIPN